jgi:hypothetical protein
MTTHTVVELFEKRNELAGQVIQAEKLARQLRADMASIESAIKVMRPGTELPKLIPRRIEFRPRHFAKGELTRLILNHLREHPDAPVAVDDIATDATVDRTLTRHEHYRLIVTICQALNRLMDRGIVERLLIETNQRRITYRDTRWRIKQS